MRVTRNDRERARWKKLHSHLCSGPLNTALVVLCAFHVVVHKVAGHLRQTSYHSYDLPELDRSLPDSPRLYVRVGGRDSPNFVAKRALVTPVSTKIAAR
jgi:hypothetical protein